MLEHDAIMKYKAIKYFRPFEALLLNLEKKMYNTSFIAKIIQIINQSLLYNTLFHLEFRFIFLSDFVL